jgi:hypothetical protein
MYTMLSDSLRHVGGGEGEGRREISKEFLQSLELKLK